MNLAENPVPSAPADALRRRRRTALVAGLSAAAVAAVLMPWLLWRSPEPQGLPPLPDLSPLPPAMQRHLGDADARARAAPDDALAVGNLGRAYHADGFPAQALAAYSRAESLAPGEWRWKYLAGLLLLEEGRAREAARILREATAIRGDRRLGWLRLGDAEFAMGRPDAAVEAFEKARSTILGGTNPPLPPGGRGITPRDYALFRLAQVHLSQGRNEAAALALLELATAQPEFGDGLRLLSEALSRVGDVERAEQARLRAAHYPTHTPPTDFEIDALARESASKEFLLRQLSLHLREDNLQWSETLARRAAEVAPDDPEAAWAVARVRALASDPQDALRWLDKYEALGGVAPEAKSARVDALLALNRAGDAERYCRDLIARDPADPALHALLGQTLFRGKRYEDAERALTEALARTENGDWRATLGTCRAELGRRKEAAEDFRRVLAGQPDHRAALSALVEILLQEEAWGELEERAHAMARIYEQPWVAHYAIARAASETGRKAEAIANCERALEFSPGYPPARALLETLKR